MKSIIKKIMPNQYWLVVIFSILSFQSFAVIEVFDFDSPQQEAQFQELSHTLRCPKCQNNSISDSDAELAKDLREKVYEMTKDGKSKQEIVDYMVARYGNFVTYNPPVTPSTIILWVAPVLVVVFGFLFMFIRTRRLQAQNQTQDWDQDKEARLKDLLEDDSLVEQNKSQTLTPNHQGVGSDKKDEA